MKRGRRKNLRQEQDLRLKECQSIVSLRGSNQIENLRGEQDFRLKECQSIVSPRGSNQIEIMDAKGENSLALVPESMCLKRGVTQRKRRRGRSDMCEVSLDLVVEILIRLPAKSLLRFKCVSKQWSLLISSPFFCHRLFTLTRRQQQQQYMSLEDDDGQRILLSVSSTSPDKTCFVVDQDVSTPGPVGLFLNVVRGLICFPVSKTACVYNSTTGQRLTLPAVEPDIKAEKAQMKKDTRYYIGYDPVNDQYKLVCTVAEFSGFYSEVKSEHWVLLLEAGGGSWKKVVPLESYHPHVPSKQVWSTTNGSVVHYTAWIDEYTRAVVSFDIRSEELTTTPVPEEAGDVGVEATWTEKGLIEYGGEIAVFDHTRLKDEGLVDLWVLKDAVGEKKWSEKERLVLQPCQRHLVPDDDNELVVKGTTQDGKLIFAPSKMHSSQLYILFYDLQRNDLRKVGIKGVPPLWSDKDCYFGLRLIDESESLFCFKSLNCC